jgi:hypothetical protein
MKRFNLFKLLIIMAFLCSACCMGGDNDDKIQNIKFILKQSRLNKAENIEVIFDLVNISSKDTFVVIADPWIKESWDSNGSYFSVFVDTVCRYPFVQLLDSPVGGEGEIYREYPFSAFKHFVAIPYSDTLTCKIEMNLNKNVLEKLNYKLSILIEIPYTDLNTYSENMIENQILNPKDLLKIDLVTPEYYPYITEDKFKDAASMNNIFNLLIGYSGVLDLSKD